MAQKKVMTIDDAPEAAAVPAGAEEAKPAVVEVSGNNADPELSGKRAKLTIFEQDTDLGKLDVTLGLNGVAYRIKRNMMVDVPVELIGVLRDSVEEVYEANGGQVVKRQRPRFSYQVHD